MQLRADSEMLGYTSGQLGTGRIWSTQSWRELLCHDSSERLQGSVGYLQTVLSILGSQ